MRVIMNTDGSNDGDNYNENYNHDQGNRNDDMILMVI